jgi:hypothetical protein
MKELIKYLYQASNSEREFLYHLLLSKHILDPPKYNDMYIIGSIQEYVMNKIKDYFKESFSIKQIYIKDRYEYLMFLSNGKKQMDIHTNEQNIDNVLYKVEFLICQFENNI